MQFSFFLLLCVDFLRLCGLCWWWQCWSNLWFWITLPEYFGLTSWVFSIPSVMMIVVMMMIMIVMIGRWEPFRNDYRTPNFLPIRKPNFFPIRNPNLRLNNYVKKFESFRIFCLLVSMLLSIQASCLEPTRAFWMAVKSFKINYFQRH